MGFHVGNFVETSPAPANAARAMRLPTAPRDRMTDHKKLLQVVHPKGRLDPMRSLNVFGGTRRQTPPPPNEAYWGKLVMAPFLNDTTT